MEQYSSDIVLVPGELIGYREWVPDSEGLLFPITYRVLGPWGPGLNEARCGLSLTDGDVPHRAHVESFQNALVYNRLRGVSPQDEIEAAGWENTGPIRVSCDSCGIYAKYSWSLSGPAKSVVGVVAASGRIVLGTKGFRAQKARILALSNGLTVRELRASPPWGLIARFYDVPVFADLWDMLDRYPPSDLSVVAPEVAETLRLGRERLEQFRATRMQAFVAAVSVAEYLERNSQIHGEGQI